MTQRTGFWTSLADRSTDAAALITSDGTVTTYGALLERCDIWQRRFRDEAGRIGTDRLLIGLALAAEPDSIAAYLAALRSGHAVVIAAAENLVAGQRIDKLYQPNLVLANSQGALSCTRRSDKPAALHEDLCLLLSTSGTTGNPKLVRLSATNVASNATAIRTYLGLNDSDRGATTLPLHYSYGLSVLNSHLDAGAALVLTDMSVSDPGFGALARGLGVTGLALVPHQVDLMLARNFDFADLPALRRITQAGGRLAPPSVRHMGAVASAGGWEFYVMYGQTEASPRMAYLPPKDITKAADTIGCAIPGGRFWLVDADGAEISEAGRAGELVYSGPNVMMGYALDRVDLALGHQTPHLRTGDVAERTDKGYFRIVGRVHRFVKLFGLRIGLDDAERILSDHGIAGWAEAVDGNLVVLTGHGDLAQICTILSDTLKIPADAVTAVRLAEVPYLSNGKVDRRQMGAMAARTLTASKKSERHGTGLAPAYRAATRARRIEPSNSFVDLGGDSLGYLHVQLAIEERIGFVPEGWEHMSIADLEGMAPRARNARVSVDASALLRILAITSVVLFHLTLWPVNGGTFVLILLLGHSLARFQKDAIIGGDIWRIARSLLIPILPIYYLLLVAYDLLRGHIPPEMYLLIGNLPRRLNHDLFEPFWYISLYAQIVLIIIVLTTIPAVRNTIHRSAFAFGLLATVTASLLSMPVQLYGSHTSFLVGPAEGGFGLPLVRTVFVLLPLVFLGWSVSSARTTLQRLLCVLALFVTCIVLPVWSLHERFMIVATVLILLVPNSLQLPFGAALAVRHMAAATMFVYLTHNTVIHVWKHATDLYWMTGPVLSALIVLPLAFGVGLATRYGYGQLEKQLWRLLRITESRS